MNYKLNFAHLCDYASLSSGKLNVLGVFKNINSPSFPYLHPQMYVVTNIKFSSSGEYMEEIRISIGETVIASNKQTILIESPNTDLGIIAQLNNIEFKTEGDYSVDILINEATLDRIPFTIREIRN